MLIDETTGKRVPSNAPWKWNVNCQGQRDCKAYELNNGRLRCGSCIIEVPDPENRQTELKLD